MAYVLSSGFAEPDEAFDHVLAADAEAFLAAVRNAWVWMFRMMRRREEVSSVVCFRTRWRADRVRLSSLRACTAVMRAGWSS